MKKRVIIANTLMVLGALLALSGLLALALWHEHQHNPSPELASLLYLLKAYNPPDVWVPILSHLGGGAVMLLAGERMRRTAKSKAQADQVRAEYFQTA